MTRDGETNMALASQVVYRSERGTKGAKQQASQKDWVLEEGFERQREVAPLVCPGREGGEEEFLPNSKRPSGHEDKVKKGTWRFICGES